MPQIDLKYSNDLNLDCKLIFNTLEKIINSFDATSGECKSRAYPCSSYSYSHVLVEIKIMKKAHRDKLFCEKLLGVINNKLSEILRGNYYFSLSVDFISNFYLTKKG